MDTIMQARNRIEREFGEPLRDVIAGYAQMKYSMPYVAEVLECSVSSVKHFCSSNGIRFSRSPMEHRAIGGRPPRMIRHAGREQSLTAWAMDLGLSVEGVRKRLRTRGSIACPS